MNFPELSLTEWGEALFAPLDGKRYPIGGTLEITDRCNIACVHCYINQAAADREVKSRELSTVQITGLMDQLADAGCLFLLLTGGEVLIRPDFLDIFHHARRRGMLVSIFTNGTLLSERIADDLAQWTPRSIEITLYGATQQTYESVTRIPGSYARCMQGIYLLLERGLPLLLKSVLLKNNLHELDAMQNLAQQLGVNFRYDGTLWPRLDGGEQPYDYRLSLREMLNLDVQDPQRLAEWEKTAVQFSGQPIRAENVYSCGAGLRSFHIDSSGKLSICTMARRPSYDLLSIVFQEAWEKLGELRKAKRQLNTVCRTCTIGGLCNQCPGWSQAVHDDDETPVDYICNLAHLRATMIQK